MPFAVWVVHFRKMAFVCSVTGSFSSWKLVQRRFDAASRRISHITVFSLDILLSIYYRVKGLCSQESRKMSTRSYFSIYLVRSPRRIRGSHDCSFHCSSDGFPASSIKPKLYEWLIHKLQIEWCYFWLEWVRFCRIALVCSAENKLINTADSSLWARSRLEWIIYW